MATGAGKKSMEAMTPELLAEILRKSGSKSATADIVRKMISEGAPTNPNGTLSFVKFTAYMEKMHNGNV